MADWAQKRFWTEARVVEEETGFVVELDGRRVKTPAKSALILPTRTMAEAMAAEWDAQEDKIKPDTMPVTRSANAAIDKVMTQHGEVADMLAEYGGTDLLCYRAETPVELVARQNERWDPMLDWAEEALGVRLTTAAGVMFIPQSPEVLSKLSKRVHAIGPFELAAFHDLVSLSGSLILGFAAALESRPILELWDLSQLDENWQIEQWGPDDDATELALIKRSAFEHAARFFAMAQD